MLVDILSPHTRWICFSEKSHDTTHRAADPLVMWEFWHLLVSKRDRHAVSPAMTASPGNLAAIALALALESGSEFSDLIADHSRLQNQDEINTMKIEEVGHAMRYK
jgi:hypothetical protein